MSKVIIDIPGGFGNQLFGYAFGYALSKEIGAEYYIHTPLQDSGITWELQLRYLNIEYDGNLTYLWTKKLLDRVFLNKLRRRLAIGLSTKIDKNPELESLQAYVDSHMGNTLYYGNWENEKFIKKYRDDLIKMITPREKRSESVTRIIEDINNCKHQTVGLHIRRGDKVKIGGSHPIEYYVKAIEMMKERVGTDAIFYVVSDDISWCKNNLSSELARFVYPKYKSDTPVLDDWLILKACNNHIMGDTTYCWWAAWLSQNPEQVVICPKNRVTGEWVSCEI